MEVSCSATTNNSAVGSDSKLYMFDLFLPLQGITEIFFLLNANLKKTEKITSTKYQVVFVWLSCINRPQLLQPVKAMMGLMLDARLMRPPQNFPRKMKQSSVL